MATLPSAMPQTAVSLIDLDGDTDLDLVVADQFADALGVWRGDGTGQFTFKEQVPAGNGPVAIAVGDVDADGDPDLAVPLISAGAVNVLRNVCSLSTYCVAKVNSLGCTPAMAAAGTPSASATSGWVLSAANVINNKSGLMLYTVNGRNAVPFQGGTLCLEPPIKRTTGVDSGGTPPPNNCSGVFAIDMNAFAQGLLGGNPLSALTNPGTVVDCQWWGRDQGFPAPNNTTLSDALEYIVQP
jgi:hypothetical protein